MKQQHRRHKKKENSSWIQETSQIRAHFKDSFINQFKEEETCFLEHFEHLILLFIIEEENESLQSILSSEEIKAAMFQMQDLKAPGPNVFLALFYKQLWPTVGNDVIKAVTSFFYLGLNAKIGK